MTPPQPPPLPLEQSIIAYNQLSRHFKIARIYRFSQFCFILLTTFMAIGWVFGLSSAQYAVLILAPNSFLSFIILFLSDLSSPTVSTLEYFTMFVAYFGCVTSWLGTVLDGAPVLSSLAGAFALCCLPSSFRSIIRFRAELLDTVPFVDLHLKKVIFLGAVGVLIPTTYLLFDSIGCVVSVPDFTSLNRSSRAHRLDDAIYETCSAVFVPNYSLALHLVALQCCASCFAPKISYTLSEVMRFRLSLRNRLQCFCVTTATFLALFIFAAKEDDSGAVHENILKLTSLLFLLWGTCVFLQALSNDIFEAVVLKCLSWAVDNPSDMVDNPSDMDDGMLGGIEGGKNNKPTAPPDDVNLDDLRAKSECELVPISPPPPPPPPLPPQSPKSFFRFSTQSNVEIAPVYKLLAVTNILTQLLLSSVFFLFKNTRSMWLFYLNLPLGTLSLCIFWFANPRKQITKIDVAVVLAYPLSFLLSALGNYNAQYWVDKAPFKLIFVLIFFLIVYPIFRRLRTVISNLSDEGLAHHMEVFVFTSFGGYVSMLFFLAEGFGCVAKGFDIEGE